MRYLLVIMFLVACNSTARGEQDSPYQMSCSKASNSLTRCENKEVICYYKYHYNAGGLQCRFKIKEAK